MRIGIHQPMYLPWLGIFDRINQCDLFILLDNVPFGSKNYFLHRNKIKTRDGWTWLTVPVALKGKTGQLIKDVEIDNSLEWRKKHWMSIYHFYNKAPYFSRYSDFIENVYQREWQYLATLSYHLLAYLLEQIGIDTEIKWASSLDITGKKEELIFNICRAANADDYLSGPDGRNYLPIDFWRQNNIKLFFHDYQHPQYPQLHGEFLPQMSIIDLLFNCGPESLSILRN
jgi:hypothetical protein